MYRAISMSFRRVFSGCSWPIFVCLGRSQENNREMSNETPHKKHIPQSELLSELSGHLSDFGNLLVLRALQILPGNEAPRNSNPLSSI